MGTSEGKVIDTSQNKLNFIKNYEIWRKFWKICFSILGVS